MSDTPRTDAQVAGRYPHAAYEVPINFARQLERELNEAKTRIEVLEGVLRKYLATADRPMGMADIADIDAEARTTLEKS